MSGENIDEIRSIAALLDELDERVRDVVQPTRPTRPSVELVAIDDPLSFGWVETKGRGDRVVSRTLCLSRKISHPRYALAHELTHWYVDGVCRTLTPVLEEALCERVAVDLDPEGAAVQRRVALPALDVLESVTLTWAARVSRAEQDRLSEVESRRWYSVAFRLSERLHPPQLRAWCERAEREGLAQVPAEWVLEEVLGAATR